MGAAQQLALMPGDISSSPEAEQLQSHRAGAQGGHCDTGGRLGSNRCAPAAGIQGVGDTKRAQKSRLAGTGLLSRRLPSSSATALKGPVWLEPQPRGWQRAGAAIAPLPHRPPQDGSPRAALPYGKMAAPKRTGGSKR